MRNRNYLQTNNTSVPMTVGVVFIALIMVFIGAIIAYNGERVVNGQTVDCIGLLDEKPSLPEGWTWQTGANPLVPSFFIYPPIGPIVVGLTDAVCPKENVRD